ncbi:MAG: hypothetical protein OSA23_09565, partial [Rhodospirillales bacterium]|nr:hypothetical protein [Rhodospirillales bacterium]
PLVKWEVFLTHLVQKPGGFSDPLRIASVASCCAQSCRSKPAVQVANWKPWQKQTRRTDFTKSFKDNGWF